MLAHFAALRLPMGAEHLDDVLSRADREGLTPLQFLDLLIGEQADRRRDRRIERRIQEARFRDPASLESFDWQFNAKAIDRQRIEGLASGGFIERGENLVLVGQSGVGKSHLLQAIGRRACAGDHRVRYTTSAQLFDDLTASMADGTLASRLRYYSRFDLLIIDELGFDRIERTRDPQAASLLYKVIDARTQHRSTALATNVDFDGWGEYLGDAPLAMALLDRLVDGAIVMKITGRSYRAERPKRIDDAPEASSGE